MTRTRSPEPEGFDAFWAIWRPHRRKTDGRGDARGAFAKAILNGNDPETIVEAAEHFLSTMKDADRPYIPLAATWLNREPFEDILDDKADAERRRQQAAEARAQHEQRRENVTQLRPKTKFLEQWEARQPSKTGEV